MKTILVIGGGASGMAAAAFAKTDETRVILLEKNEKTGKKLYITGKGRCNLTNASDIETILQNVVTNPRFLYSALYGFTNEDLMRLMEEKGCPLKTERGNRVFPVSDHSSDVIRTWNRILSERGVEVRLHTEVSGLLIRENRVCGVRLGSGRELPADSVIVCTGGLSYPSTGSTGDGYRFAGESGHRLVDEIPSLVPFECEENFVRDLAGLSLRNVKLSLEKGHKIHFSEFGEMLFTHTGISGPLVLSASAVLGRLLQKEGKLHLLIDLKPALSEDELDRRILRDFSEAKNRDFRNALSGLLPGKLQEPVIALSGIPAEKKVHDITREERKKLAGLLKAFPLTAVKTRGFQEAVITKGGIHVKDVNPSTMESRIVKNLYFAGEVLDVDALTGGYNLQIAWSTGVLAGRSAAKDPAERSPASAG